MFPDERKRFRARFYDGDPGLAVGDRHLFTPTDVTEEWSLTSARVRPDPVRLTAPRPGDVVKVIPARPDDGRPWWEVMADDPAPLAVPVEVVMSVVGPRLLAPFPALSRLLDHLASRALGSDVERAGVANACAPWLRERFPALVRAATDMPDYTGKMLGDPVAAEPLYRAYLDGVRAGLGYTQVPVPVPPFTLAPTGPPTSGNLRPRHDVIDRLLRRHRAN